MQKKTLGLLALVFAAFLGGAVAPTLIKTGVTTMHPFSFNFFRYLFTTIIFLPFLPKILKNNDKIDLLKSLPFLSMMGANALLFSIGIQHTTVVASQLIYALIPAVVAILSWILLKKKPSKNKIIGIGIAILGIIILITSSLSNNQSNALGTISGNLTIVLGMFLHSIYLIYSKKYSKKYSSTTITILTGISLIILFIPFLGYDIVFAKGLSQISQSSWIALILLSLMTAVFILCIQYGVKILSATTSAMTILLSPIFAFISGIFLFDERISINLIISLSLVFLGIIVSVLSNNNKLINKT